MGAYLNIFLDLLEFVFVADALELAALCNQLRVLVLEVLLLIHHLGDLF